MPRYEFRLEILQKMWYNDPKEVIAMTKKERARLAVDALKELFAREELVIQKKTKHKTMADVDIRPMIHSMEMEEREGLIMMRVVVQAQNPGLNPSLLVKAIETHLADLAPDFARVHRNEVMDAEMKKFR